MSKDREPENVIQSACADALAVYFYSKGVLYRQLWTYSNQQGEDTNKFCGDLVSVIDNCILILIEFKALDHSTGNLHAFDQAQYDEALQMESRGVPLVYCYDRLHPLPYNLNPQPKKWPSETLAAMNVSVPTRLTGLTPQINQHEDLLSWLESQQVSDPISKLAKSIGGLLPNKLRNGLVTIMYSKSANQAFELKGESLTAFHQWLSTHPGSSDEGIQKKLRSLQIKISIAEKIARERQPPHKGVRPK